MNKWEDKWQFGIYQLRAKTVIVRNTRRFSLFVMFSKYSNCTQCMLEESKKDRTGHSECFDLPKMDLSDESIAKQQAWDKAQQQLDILFK